MEIWEPKPPVTLGQTGLVTGILYLLPLSTRMDGTENFEVIRRCL